jgi:hypothetical protein
MSSILADQQRPRLWSPNAGEGGESCGVSANEYSCAHGAQINSGDQTPYLSNLTYGFDAWGSNVAPSYMSTNAGEGGGESCGVSANEYSCALRAQINSGDQTPYLSKLTYGFDAWI